MSDSRAAPGSGSARPLRVGAAIATLSWREIIRFLRQRNRVIGAVGQPILFWLLFGAGLRSSFRLTDDPAGPSFLEYYFPGTLILILLFTAIFSTISIIEDRREGFLQSVLVSPLPSWAMVLGKILGGSVIATGQGLIFLLLGLTIPVNTNPLSLAALVLLLWIASLALTSLGFVIAWRMESTQGFHAIMNLALMPMWLLSGAFFPVPRTSDGSWSGPVLHWIMRLNPVTYVVSGARQLLFDTPPAAGLWSPSLTTCWVVSLLFAALLTGAAWKVSEQRVTGDLL